MPIELSPQRVLCSRIITATSITAPNHHRNEYYPSKITNSTSIIPIELPPQLVYAYRIITATSIIIELSPQRVLCQYKYHRNKYYYRIITATSIIIELSPQQV